MALSVDFSAAQTPGSPGDILLTDTSTGTDVAVTQRRVYIQTAAGDYLVEEATTTEYTPWDDFPSTTTLSLTDILDKDYGVRMVVQWLDVSNTVLYDKTLYYGFTCYNEDFDYELTQTVAGNPLLISDNNFWGNKSTLRGFIDSGDNAITRNSDIAAAQQCYDLATNMRTNSQYFFNINS
jgi:hypothetical protein